MERVVELTHAEFLESYDWKYIFENFMAPTPVLGYTGSVEPFGQEDVVRIYALVEGENDGQDWVGVFQTNDGRYAAITAGCDYTGRG